MSTDTDPANANTAQLLVHKLFCSIKLLDRNKCFIPCLSNVEARLVNAEILKDKKTTSAEPDERGKCFVILLLLICSRLRNAACDTLLLV